MSYEFDERTDKPKRYCPVSKLSQQEMPKTDEPRCRYCCERLVAGGNWLERRRRSGSADCSRCGYLFTRGCRCRNGGVRAQAVNGRGLARYVAGRLRDRATKRGKVSSSIDELESEIKRFLKTGCAICGCALRLRNAGEQGAQEGCLQVDCIDPREGYIVGNIQGLCPTCNRQKDNHTLESAERLYKHLLAHEYKRKYGFELHHLPVKPTLPVKPIPAEPPEVPTRG